MSSAFNHRILCLLLPMSLAVEACTTVTPGTPAFPTSPPSPGSITPAPSTTAGVMPGDGLGPGIDPGGHFILGAPEPGMCAGVPCPPPLAQSQQASDHPEVAEMRLFWVINWLPDGSGGPLGGSCRNMTTRNSGRGNTWAFEPVFTGASNQYIQLTTVPQPTNLVDWLLTDIRPLPAPPPLLPNEQLGFNGGQYGWDVSADGCYFVEAEYGGETSRSPVVGIVGGSQPPIVDLHVCWNPETTPPTHKVPPDIDNWHAARWGSDVYSVCR